MFQPVFGGRCAQCHEVVNTAILGSEVPCPKCNHRVVLYKLDGPLAVCGRCQLLKPVVGMHLRHAKLGSVCASCWDWLDLPKVVCPRCHKKKRKHRSTRHGLCPSCVIALKSEVASCPECGDERLLCCWDSHGEQAVCSTCADKLRDPIAFCSVCGKKKRLNNKHPYAADQSRVCSCCYKALTVPQGCCSLCGETKQLPYLHRGTRICGRCQWGLKHERKRPRDRTLWKSYPHVGCCAECNEERMLERSHPSKEGGICFRCRKRSQKQFGICGRCKQPRQLVRKHPKKPEKRICSICVAELRGKPAAPRRNVHFDPSAGA